MKKTVIPLDPVAKPRMTRGDRWKKDPNHPDPKKRKRPAVVKYHQFCEDLNKLVTGQPEPVFKIRFNVPMPRSWPEKSKANPERSKSDMDGKPHQQTPDIDNFLKAYLDALCDNDSYVYDVHPTKYWAREGSIVVEE